MVRKWIVCVCLTLIGCSVSFAAGTQVQGKVVDPGGAAIANAAVSLTDLTTNKVTHTTTGTNGQFVFSDVPAEPQLVTVEKSGFESFTQRVSPATQHSASIVATLQVATLSRKRGCSWDC